MDMEATGCGEVRRGTPPPARHTRQTLACRPGTRRGDGRARDLAPARRPPPRRRHGKLDVSWEPDGAIPPDGRFYPNPDPPAAYPLLELERAGIIRPVEPAITVYGPYGRPTRLMEVTEPYHNPMLRALRMR